MATEQNNNSVPTVTNTFNGGMVKDLNTSFNGEGVWSHARNAVNNSHSGELGVIGNEPANILCVELPYTLIGAIPTENEEWLLFTTDNTHSEIGIFNDLICSYQTLVNDSCLNFNTKNLITGVSRRTFDCSIKVYFSDGVRNPDRVIDINKIPWKTHREYTGSCYEDVPNQPLELDCEKLRLAPLMTVPCLKLSKYKGIGTLSNGSYQAAVAYSVNGIRITDYIMLSNPISIWDHNGIAGALELEVTNTDVDFDELELVIISTISGQTVAKKLGVYSTTQSKITIDTIDPSLVTIPLEFIPIQTPAIEKSDNISTVSDYLLRSGIYLKPDFNYQPLANKINTKWQAVKYKSDYYRHGGNPGYLRDEQYAFFIRWIYNTGERSACYHIPGREYNSSTDGSWLTQNTASITSIPGTVLPDGGVVIAEGLMGYWESTELYPSNQYKVWEDLCGTPIRHHKFPDQTISSGASINHFINNGDDIVVMGVKFDNIQFPVDNSGNQIPGIVGYEILRGNREGHKSILGKGLINNMRTYSDGSQSGLFQNYPYNDLRPDPYYNPLSQGITRNIVSFHSPDTTFTNPYLIRSQLKVCGELGGISYGNFETPYKHPEFKVLTNFSSILGSIIGAVTGLNSFSRGVTITGTEDLPYSTTVGPLGPFPQRQRVSYIGGVSTSVPNPLDFSDDIAYAVQVADWILNAIAITTFATQLADVNKEKILQMITALVPHKQYAAQYNSHGFYNQFTSRNQLIDVTDSGYVKGNVQNFSGLRINNLYRDNFVILKLNSNLNDTTIVDNSRFLGEPGSGTQISSIASNYGSLKVNIPSQYGQIDSIKIIPISSCVSPVNYGSTMTYSSDVLFGGDIYISRYTEKNPMFFFNDWLLREPNDFQYDYRNSFNVPNVKYWIDNRKAYYDFFSLMTSYRNLYNTTSSVFYVKSGWFYLFNNGVKDFFVESEINLNYRDYEEDISKRFYDPYSFTDTSSIFRSDIIKSPGYYKYDFSLSVSKLFNQYISWGSTLTRDYDPDKAETCYVYYPRRVAYSLPQSLEYKKDNWRSFLANNYKDFTSKVTCIKPINKNGAIIMMDKEAPISIMGVDNLETSGGVKITVGDGGLFNQPLQSITNTDRSLQYGSCQSRFSVIGTPQGVFWVSQDQGKIFQYSNGLKEISRSGMKWWFSRYLPSKLLKQFPNYKYYDNPVFGIGTQMIYDNINEVLYITKKDYSLKPNVDINYDDDTGFWKDGGSWTEVIPGEIIRTCPPGYTLTYEAGAWVCKKSGTVPAWITSTQKFNVHTKTFPDTGVNGSAIYDPGYSPTSTIGTHTDITTGYLSTSAFAEYLSIWPDATYFPAPAGSSPEAPANWGMNVCVHNNSNTTKTYYLAVTGYLYTLIVDRMVIDSGTYYANDPIRIITIKNNSSYNSPHGLVLPEAMTTKVNFYPVDLPPGYNNIRIIATRWSFNTLQGSLGFAFLDNTSSQLNSATSLSDLNIVTSSRDILNLGYSFFYIAGCNGQPGISQGEGCVYYCNGEDVIPATITQGPDTTIVHQIKIPVSLCDPTYFKDCSWTISYDTKNEKWISFHDWHPELMIASKNHFLTSWRPCNYTKSSLWRHNSVCDLYCNYYNIDYPFEVETVINTGQTITTLHNVEYQLECFKYSSNCQDKFHFLDENFDRAIVYNTEEISGLLELNIKTKNNPLANLVFPSVNLNSISILYSKEENKYRFNQFWDITKDRGEFSGAQTQMFNTDDNGYTYQINPAYVDYSKNPLKRKKFRHYSNKLVLRKNISGSVKMNLKLINAKLQPSNR